MRSPIKELLYMQRDPVVGAIKTCSGETIFHGITIRFILSFYISDFIILVVTRLKVI